MPLLVTLTDRIEARRIYIAAVSITALAHLGMAFPADGFLSALIFRILAGIGWAGTYMVGLKAPTAGTVGSAEPGRHGAALAIHVMMGYGGGFVGPLVMGMLLDWLGGESVLNWGLSFAHLAVIMLIGPAAFAVLKPRNLSGDRPAP